jgi:vacuolar-type H+-ATPase subunit H
MGKGSGCTQPEYATLSWHSMGENGLNEKLIQQVLEIEEQAQAIHEAAMHEAEQLPKQAEQEAQAVIEKARADTREEARRLVASAQAQEECARILAQAEEEAHRMEALASRHFDRAVGYVLDRVAGRE